MKYFKVTSNNKIIMLIKTEANEVKNFVKEILEDVPHKIEEITKEEYESITKN